MGLALLFATDAPRIAGSEIWLAEVLPRLVELGNEIYVALPNTDGLNKLALHFQEKHVQVIRYSGNSELANIDIHVDIRILQAWSPVTYKVLNYWPNPRWIFTHDQIIYHYPLGLKHLYEAIFRLTKVRSMKLSDGVLTCSMWAANYFKEKYRLNAIGIPNGIDINKFRPPNEDERQRLRREFGFTRFTWLMPARYSMEKNHITALLTAKMVPEADFVFVGSGNLRVYLEYFAKSFGVSNARFLPFVSEMNLLYRAADGLFFPTLAENQSLTTLEAMASGLPIVTSNIPAQKELIKQGREGLTVPPVPKKLSTAIKVVQHDRHLAQKMGSKAREKIVRDHDIRKTTANLSRALEWIANVGGKG